MDEFKILYEQLHEAQRVIGESEHEQVLAPNGQDARISELMLVAQELAEPEPVFFSRG